MRRKWIGIERGEQVYSHCKVGPSSRVIDNADVEIPKRLVGKGVGDINSTNLQNHYL